LRAGNLPRLGSSGDLSMMVCRLLRISAGQLNTAQVIVVMREFGVQVASLSETIRRLDKSTGRMFLVASIRGGDVEDDST
jgi:hypothetical protein